MDCGGFFAGLAMAAVCFTAGVFTADFFATPFLAAVFDAAGCFATDFYAAISCLAAGLSIGHPAPDENTMIARWTQGTRRKRRGSSQGNMKVNKI
jgi:hypothetical protein